ncbi:hypothetical protein KHQ81_15685 (plasmid) [Mycoplasmatota bacterium]|nr:hypothetical protein KHQ81_15685 [Mycoplasmatota bacterium]
MLYKSLKEYLESMNDNQIIEVIDTDDCFTDVIALDKQSYKNGNNLTKWVLENCQVIGKDDEQIIINLSDIINDNVECLIKNFKKFNQQEYNVRSNRNWDIYEWSYHFTIDTFDMLSQDDSYSNLLYNWLQKANNNSKDNIGKSKFKDNAKFTIMNIENDIALLYRETEHSHKWIVALGFNSSTFDWGQGRYPSNFINATKVYEKEVRGINEFEKREIAEKFYQKLVGELNGWGEPLINDSNKDFILETMEHVLESREFMDYDISSLYINLFKTFKDNPDVINLLFKLNPEIIGQFEENNIQINSILYNMAIENGLDPNSNVAKECVEILNFRKQNELSK